jgi:hypothetical protein
MLSSIIEGIVSALARVFERLFRESQTGLDGTDGRDRLRRAGSRIRAWMRSSGSRTGDQSRPSGGAGEGSGLDPRERNMDAERE